MKEIDNKLTQKFDEYPSFGVLKGKPCRMYAMLLNLNLTVFPYHANMKTVF